MAIRDLRGLRWRRWWWIVRSVMSGQLGAGFSFEWICENLRERIEHRINN